ncbi:hypothetical protein BD289DRAFT_422961 [Coniella lustricola]|uniref:Secreted protein n=1 Tax=Coniella lustricola TaxID=2025994 RepID=A0A2T3AK18_9PEZI|nr:hypothetical protein BD289DRAFT_422961 [Coniella lustricola]
MRLFLFCRAFAAVCVAHKPHGRVVVLSGASVVASVRPERRSCQHLRPRSFHRRTGTGTYSTGTGRTSVAKPKGQAATQSHCALFLLSPNVSLSTWGLVTGPSPQ